MKKELVSIIVPVYNGEKYIEKCIESINKQTYKEIEIIVINDGSTDKTKEILEEISMKQKNMTILNKKENKGTAICKNIGIQHSKGKYIFFVDSDDTITEDAINKMLNLLKKNNGDAIRTTYRFDYNGKIVKGNEKIENIAFAQNRKVELIQKFLLDQIHGFCSGVFLLKKDIIIKNNIRFKEDMISFRTMFMVWRRQTGWHGLVWGLKRQSTLRGSLWMRGREHLSWMLCVPLPGLARKGNALVPVRWSIR